MKNLVCLLIGMAMSGAVLAGPATYVEFGYVTGGENNDRGDSVSGNDKKNGWELAGSYAFDQNWYAGGIIGTYDRRDTAENDYINFNGGYVSPLNPKTNLIAEGGLWFGEQKTNSGFKTDPKAIEGKVGLDSKISDKFSVFGTVSFVFGDLDTVDNDDLSNFIWSLGGAYSFTDLFSVNVKLVNGVNGVNGQDEVLRIAARWTF